MPVIYTSTDQKRKTVLAKCQYCLSQSSGVAGLFLALFFRIGHFIGVLDHLPDYNVGTVVIGRQAGIIGRRSNH